jgi:hypothetical protein
MSDTLKRVTSVVAIETTTTIDLGDFREEYRGGTFDVWVEPSRAHWREWNEYVDWFKSESERLEAEMDAIEDDDERETFNTAHAEQLERERTRRLDKWLSETWRNLSLDEVTAVREHLQDTYMEAWNWLFNATLGAMMDYHADATKN